MNAQPLNATLPLGQQTFDGLGRQLTVTVGKRTTGYEYKAEQMPPSANVLPDGKRVDFTYEPALDNQVLSISPAGEAASTFAYDASLALIKSSTGALGQQTMTYTVTGQPKTNTWKVDGKDHATTWRYALGGLLLGFNDADGVAHAQRFDAVGRPDRMTVADVTLDMTYDEFDRPESFTCTDTISGKTLLQTLTYDGLGREHTRTFTMTLGSNPRSVVQTLGYNALDQLISRQWREAEQVGEESFAYDTRGRLIHYTANETAAPTDPFGNRVIEQVFTLNVLNGYEKVTSTFLDGRIDIATFRYANDDPTQVSSIDHDHPSWPSRIDLSYDDCGRVRTYRFPATGTRPALDRTLTWDAQDRLIKVDDQSTTCDYRYAPNGQLTDRVIDGTLTRSFFSADQPTHEQTGDATLRLTGNGSALFAQTRLAAGVHQATTLLGCDAQGSVRIEADSEMRTRFYTAHGAESADGDNSSPFGFTGQRRDTFTGWYIPSGYRPYDPIVMGFLSPDSDSPFGQGGLNPYAYCAGDPVNRIDPSGHGWLTWLVAGIGIGLGILGTVATLGAAAPVLAAVAAGGIGALTASGAMAIGVATLSAVSLGTGIASTVLEATDKDSKAASILGWVSIGTGLAELGLAMAPKAAAKLAAWAGRSVGRASVKASKGAAQSTARTTSAQGSDWVGSSEILSRGANGRPDVAVHHRLWKNHLGFETHGSRGGNLMNANGRLGSAEEFARDVIYPRLQVLNHPKNEPIVLLACHGGRSGAAQRIADLIETPVIGWSESIYVVDPGRLNKTLRITPWSYHSTNYPTRLRLEGETSYFKWEWLWGRRRLPAHFTIYHPAP